MSLSIPPCSKNNCQGDAGPNASNALVHLGEAALPRTRSSSEPGRPSTTMAEDQNNHPINGTSWVTLVGGLNDIASGLYSSSEDEIKVGETEEGDR